jgi:glutamate 5-kinase
MTARPRCGIIVDDGAKRALLDGGKSLLPIGVLAARDHFDRGDSVQVLDQAGELIAVGLSNYSSDELVHIIGCQTCDIEARLGYKPSDEVIHRDNMVVGDDLKI